MSNLTVYRVSLCLQCKTNSISVGLIVCMLLNEVSDAAPIHSNSVIRQLRCLK